MLMVSIIGEDLAALSRAASMALWRGSTGTRRVRLLEPRQHGSPPDVVPGGRYLLLLGGAEAEVVEDSGLQGAEGLQQCRDEARGVGLQPGARRLADLHQGLDAVGRGG